MCERCGDMANGFRISHPDDYKEFCGLLAEREERGDLTVVNSPPDATLRIVSTCTVWPDDSITHRVSCADCGAKFELMANTYRGGCSWSGEQLSPSGSV